MEPLQRQKLLLEAEIRQLEKTRREAESAVERFDVQQTQAFQQGNQQLKELQRQKDQLIIDVQNQREALESLTNTFTTAKESLDAYERERHTIIEQEAINMKATAQALLATARAEKLEADTHEVQLDQREFDLDVKQNFLVGQAQRHLEAASRLDERVKRDAIEHEAHVIVVKQLQREKDELVQSIDSLTREREVIAHAIETKVQANARDRHLLDEKFRELEVREQAATNQERVNKTKADELAGRERFVKDRQEQIDKQFNQLKGAN